MKLAVATAIFAAFLFGLGMIANNPTWFKHQITAADIQRDIDLSDRLLLGLTASEYATRKRVFAEEQARRDFWLKELGE